MRGYPDRPGVIFLGSRLALPSRRRNRLAAIEDRHLVAVEGELQIPIGRGEARIADRKEGQRQIAGLHPQALSLDRQDHVAEVRRAIPTRE